MIKIRKGVFETNSSSVHSIVIDVSQEPCVVDDVLTIAGGEYGWGYNELCSLEDRLNYLWQGIWDCAGDKSPLGTHDEWRQRIRKWLPNVSLEDVPEGGIGDDDDEYASWYFPGIDHGGELYVLLRQFMSNDKLLGDFLTNENSHVICSNDNSDSYGFYYPDVPYIEFRKGN